MNNLQPFHLAIPVADIETSHHFYGTLLKCPEGRSSKEWIDFDFFGHQLVVHLDEKAKGIAFKNKVDNKDVPIPHFGVVLSMEAWQKLAETLKATAGIQFVIEPCIRFKGEVGEQATLFFHDPSGNALEFKAFKDMKSLFAKQAIV